MDKALAKPGQETLRNKKKKAAASKRGSGIWCVGTDIVS